ncbi:serine/threonine-protein kinase [Agromyces agglutinans]|uniref:serine/threonine-protein kinase n=1 Tax=Agromyces agglutinans TaxID=2662258 RepID=UPI0028A8C501|nr:serine/threonine-protein kinase [Agromyces agglutinans]
MSRRLPSTPPNLPGFAFVRVLGSGGFADVFLYEQNMPRRLVAVKVLLAEVVNDEVRQMFQAEANLMAQLSSHPAILTVFQASVAADGRPYLVMEYCSSTLAQRYRAVALPLSEILSTGVRVASAVEAAHRQGVLHRDIKPSNILTTAYGHPVLSDFGIAATLGRSEQADAVGLSIPWSAPEVLREEVPGTVESEVWSLGATVYSLLAGRSPFEIPGGENGSTALISRIERAKVPPTGRADVPPELEAALARAMSRRPEERQPGALAFARDLQAVEERLGLPQTEVDVTVEDWATAVGLDVDERTRVSGEHAIASVGGARRRRRPATRPAGGHAPGQPGHHAEPRAADGVTGARQAGASGRRLVVLVTAAAVVAIALVVAVTILLVRSAESIPTVTEVRSSVDGELVEFGWDDPGLAAGDSYLVTVDGVVEPARREAAIVVDASGRDQVCASVSVSRDGRTGAASPQECVDLGSPVP